LPWHISLAGSIVIILLGLARKLNVGLIMLLGGVVLGILSGLHFGDLLAVARDSLLNRVTVVLVASILLLGILGHILKATGSLEIMIKSLGKIATDLRLITAAMPMLIGMLTVPGGAILSAPMCGAAGAQLSLPAHRQAAANIWFRHVLYFMLPLFPGLILASELSGVSTGRFVLHNLHLTVIGICGAYFYLFRGLQGPQAKGTVSLNWGQIQLFMRSLLPLLFVLALVVFFDLFFPLALALGIIAALVNFLPAQNRPNAIYSRLKTMLWPGINVKMALVIAGIMFYKEMLEDTGVIHDFTGLLISLGIPVIFLITAVPFLVGILTGDNSASVAILFPLFMPLLPHGGITYTAYLAFVYASSTAGHIISPAHPCFSLTREYFQTDFKGIAKELLPLLSLVMAAGIATTLFFSCHR
jgi:uncharacterized protein